MLTPMRVEARRLPVTSAAVAAAVVVLLVGCGGSTTSSSSTSTAPQLSRSAYSSHLQKVGATLTTELNTLGKSFGAFSRIENNVGRGQGALRAAAADLSGLNVPPDARVDNRTLVKGLREFATELDKLKQAAAGHDAKQVAAVDRGIDSSPPLQAMMGAIRDLQAKGYKLGALGGGKG
jgi:hypothetical protein